MSTGTWKFHPPCLDACDANDDGRVDLADSVYILRYLFKFDRAPKAPFPDAGPDPSYDKLPCAGGYRAFYEVVPDTGREDSSGDVRVLRVYGPGQDRRGFDADVI